MAIKSSIVPLTKDTTHSCVFDFPDRPVRPTPPVGPPPLYPYDPADDWNPSDPNDNGVPGSDVPDHPDQTEPPGGRKIQFNANIPSYSGGAQRVLAIWAVHGVSGGVWQLYGTGGFGMLYTNGSSGLLGALPAALDDWKQYGNSGGFPMPDIQVSGRYRVAIAAITAIGGGNEQPNPLTVSDWLDPTQPPGERVVAAMEAVNYASIPGYNNIFGLSNVNITTTVLSFIDPATAVSAWKIV